MGLRDRLLRRSRPREPIATGAFIDDILDDGKLVATYGRYAGTFRDDTFFTTLASADELRAEDRKLSNAAVIALQKQLNDGVGLVPFTTLAALKEGWSPHSEKGRYSAKSMLLVAMSIVMMIVTAQLTYNYNKGRGIVQTIEQLDASDPRAEYGRLMRDISLSLANSDANGGAEADAAQITYAREAYFASEARFSALTEHLANATLRAESFFKNEMTFPLLGLRTLRCALAGKPTSPAGAGPGASPGADSGTADGPTMTPVQPNGEPPSTPRNSQPEPDPASSETPVASVATGRAGPVGPTSGKWWQEYCDHGGLEERLPSQPGPPSAEASPPATTSANAVESAPEAATNLATPASQPGASPQTGASALPTTRLGQPTPPGAASCDLAPSSAASPAQGRTEIGNNASNSFADFLGEVEAVRLRLHCAGFHTFPPGRFPSLSSSVVYLNDHLTTYALYLLPALYGAMGAMLFHMRRVLDPLMPNPPLLRLIHRVVLGALVGIVLGWFFTPDTRLGAQVSDIGFGLFSLAFLFGFSLTVFFSLLDQIVTTIDVSVRRSVNEPAQTQPRGAAGPSAASSTDGVATSQR